MLLAEPNGATRITRKRHDPKGSREQFVRLGALASAGNTRTPTGIRVDARVRAFAGQLGHLLLSRSAKRTMSRSVAIAADETGAMGNAPAARPAPELFERAVEAAGIGTWECTLPDETLIWSGTTYDIFGLPRTHALQRCEALEFYSRASLAALQRTRQQALATGSGFTLDTEIVTAAGARRWMRITATVDRKGDAPHRLFGLKQDITDERSLLEQARYLAENDAMTGISNRTRFEAGLAELCAGFGSAARPGALILIDLDGFKLINDTFGHIVGDECLREAATRLSRVCDGAGMVSRVGGDEFAVLVPPGTELSCTEGLAARIVEALAEPVHREGVAFGFSASVGIAAAWACTPRELFAEADAALYAAKDAGRNTFRVFEPLVLR